MTGGTFNERIGDYLEAHIGIFKESTLKEQRSKLNRLSRIFDELIDEGLISTAQPDHIGEREIRYLVQYMKEHDISPATQQKYLQIVNNYLRYCGNLSGESAKRVLGIHPVKKPIDVLSAEEVGRIFDTIERMSGWRGSVARGMIYLSFETLARPEEIRTALVQDLDMINHRFFIRNPKGKGSYSDSQWVDLIRPDFFKELDSYLAERDAYLSRKGVRNDALFPNLYGENGQYSGNAQRELMRRVSDRSGVEFSLKMFRATGSDLFISADPSNLYAISAQLRHSNIATTQKYYADIQRSKVAERLGDSYKNIPIPKSPKDP